MESHSGMTYGKTEKTCLLALARNAVRSQDFNYITFLEYTFDVM
jgi:hypothetical protein